MMPDRTASLFFLRAVIGGALLAFAFPALARPAAVQVDTLPISAAEAGCEDGAAGDCDIQLTGISPDQGPENMATDVRVEGSGFEAGGRAVLLSGGAHYTHSLLSAEASEPVDVAIKETRAYVVGFSGLQVFDMGEPGVPVLLGSLRTGGGLSILVEDGLAYVVGFGFRIIDVSDPAQMRVVGDLPGVAGGWYVDIAVVDDIAYMPGGNGTRLAVVDVSDPAEPSLISLDILPDVLVRGLDVQDNRLYVAADGPELSIFDITTPANPIQLGAYTQSESGWRGFRVKARGGFAYVTTFRRGLDIIDVHDPAAPFLATNVRTLHASFDLELDETRAFVSSYGHLSVVEISNPAQSVLDYFVLSPPGSFFNSGGLALAGGSAINVELPHLRVFEVGDPSTPGVLAIVPELPDRIWDVAIEDGIAYTVGGFNQRGFHVVDVGDPERPVLLSQILLDAPLSLPVDLDVQDGLACMMQYDASHFDLIDVRLPGAPVMMGGLDPGGGAYGEGGQDCALDRRRAYLSIPGGVNIYSVDDPANPAFMGSFATDDPPWMTLPRDDLLYVAGGEQGLLVLDIENPASPSLLGSLSIEGTVQDLARTGDILHVAAGEGGFMTVNVQDPTAPAQIGRLQLPLFATLVTVSGDVAYVSGWLIPTPVLPFQTLAGVVGDSQFVVDISDPASPILIGGIEHRGGRIEVEGGVGFLAGNGGFKILSLNPRPDEPVVVSSTEMQMPVAAGMSPGPYTVLAVNPDGQFDLLQNAFQVEIDADGDGFGPGLDCDDQDPAINPDAPDLPGNSIDEDCDGVLSCDPSSEWKNSGELTTCIAHTCARLRDDDLMSGRDCAALLTPRR